MADANQFLIEDLKSEKQLAAELGIGRGTLVRLRERGCPYVRLGQHVYFRQQDFVAWVAENCRGTVGRAAMSE